jgi:hypothetical protein
MFINLIREQWRKPRLLKAKFNTSDTSKKACHG